MKEVFKDIPGFEGKYSVSNLGNVMSLNYLNQKKPKLLTPIKHHGGYLIVHLGASKIRMIHTLVARAFIPNPDGKKFVNHIDGNKHNNKVSNLEWVTCKENINHAIKTGLRSPDNYYRAMGVDRANHKAVDQYSQDGTFIKHWECISDAARSIGCNPCTIVNNASGRIKSCRGFIWKYHR